MRLPLIGGAYQARSNIAACARCVNLYPEKNPSFALAPMTYYQRPGLRPLVSDPGNIAPMRGVFRASTGQGYAVIGTKVYSVQGPPLAWGLTQIGTLGANTGLPVRFRDNGIQGLLVDGGPVGYTITLAGNAFAPLADPDGFFVGGATVDTIDTFILWSVPGTRQFNSTLSDQITPFDDTYTASKADYPDPLQALIVNRHEILLIGTVKSEIWYDAGNAQFPFAELPGAYIEHGTCAPYSVAAMDISTFWLSQDEQGLGYVFRQRGYDTKVISNHALSLSIQQMAQAGTVADAIGYCYTILGHAFYVLQFPSGNQTWVFDDAIGEPELAWHQEGWTDAQGILNRHRGNCGAFLFGTNVVGDWQNGTLYAQDVTVYQDTVAGVALGTHYARTFHHIALGQVDSQGAPATALGQVVTYQQFVADIDSGGGPGGPVDGAGDPTPDQVWLRWNDFRGNGPWGQAVLQSNGAPGEWATQPKWSGSGRARDRIFELSHSINGPAAINGAWVSASLTGN